jgi:quercetin dioxygenase-like cupin family protein
VSYIQKVVFAGRSTTRRSEVTDSANPPVSELPPDDPKREVRIANPDGPNMRHVSVPFGDTYTILVTGDESGGRYSLIDMHISADAGPPPHRHDFEETFTLLEGELEFTVRGQAHVVHAGSTITVPSNAPHFFRNRSGKVARMLCICSPPGLEDFFMALGVPVTSRTASTPEPTVEEMAERWIRVRPLAAKLRMERIAP